MFERFLNRSRPVGIQPAPTPLTIRLRHIDMELERFSRVERTEIVRAAIDVLLDRRLMLRPTTGEGGSR